MRVLAIICRVLLGLMFLVFGLNGFLHFIPVDAPPADSLAAKFMGSLVASGMMHLISAMQVLGGLLVLVGGTAPLGLVILGPIIVVALLFHILMAGGHGAGPALAAAVLELVLLFAYRANFAGIFDVKAQPVV